MSNMCMWDCHSHCLSAFHQSCCELLAQGSSDKCCTVFVPIHMRRNTKRVCVEILFLVTHPGFSFSLLSLILLTTCQHRSTAHFTTTTLAWPELQRNVTRAIKVLHQPLGCHVVDLPWSMQSSAELLDCKHTPGLALRIHCAFPTMARNTRCLVVSTSFSSVDCLGRMPGVV